MSKPKGSAPRRPKGLKGGETIVYDANGRTVRALMQGTNSLVLNGQLMIYGIIDPSTDPYGEVSTVRAIDVMASLAELTDQAKIVVRINSPGGSVIEGLAIYNALRAWGKPIEVHVDAMAASSASVIAMAGDEIVMAGNATIMIHDPWSVAMGGSDDFRDMADEIDRQKQIILNIYAQRTGLDPAQISAMMTAETFMSATDAVENGFADRIDQPTAIAACKLDHTQLASILHRDIVRAHAPVTAASAAQHEREAMTTAAESGAPGGKKPAVVIHNHAVPPAPPAPPATPDVNAVRAEAIKAERDRAHGISQAVRAAKLPTEFGDEMIRSGLSLPEVHAKIIDKWAEMQVGREDNPAGAERPAGTVVADATDRWGQGAMEGLMMRAGLMKADPKNEFKGLSLSELARSSLSIRNVKNTGAMSRMDMVGRAFTVRAEGPGFNATSDFPSILQNVAYKAMMKGYTEVDETFSLWTGKGSLPDFRASYRVDSGLFPSLDKVDEGAEYKYATLSDSGTMVMLATYGKMFAITRQAIINDDLGYFERVPGKMGRAAKRTIGNLVYAILNGNPVMQDGAALFSIAHGNTSAAGAGSPPTASSIGAARALMARQKDDQGLSTGVGIRPKWILVPPELADTTTTVLKADYLTGDAGLQPNYVQNAATPVVDGRLSGGSWFLAADAAMTDTIEVDYLDGVEEPFMDQRQGWTVDGAEYKVRIDAGVKALHWRGLYRNTGAGN